MTEDLPSSVVRAHERDGVVVCEVFIAAPPDTVYQYLVDARLQERWMGKDVQLDPRPGGVMRVDYGEGDVARGSFVAVEPPLRVMYTWGWESGTAQPPPGASTVEYRLSAEGPGTRLTLEHRDLPVDERGSHSEGWVHFLGRLATHVVSPDATGSPGATPTGSPGATPGGSPDATHVDSPDAQPG